VKVGAQVYFTPTTLSGKERKISCHYLSFTFLNLFVI